MIIIYRPAMKIEVSDSATTVDVFQSLHILSLPVCYPLMNGKEIYNTFKIALQQSMSNLEHPA